MHRRLMVVGLFLVSLALPLRAAVPSATINVPNKTAPRFEISVVKAIVRVTSEMPVTFSIAHGATTVSTSSIAAGSLDSFPPTLPAGITDQPPFSIAYPAGANGESNRLTVLPPLDVVAGDARRSYTFIFNLDANITPFSCADQLSADDQWTITVTSGPQIEGICVQSLDPQIAATCDASALRAVPRSEGVATVTNITSDLEQGCRIGLDCVLVLDRSGSMNDVVETGGSVTKINRLRQAVGTFLDTWQTLRDDESNGDTAPTIVSPDDRIGVVFFSSTADWLNAVTTSGTPSGLGAFATLRADIDTAVPLVNTATTTSIGAGLRLADGALTTAPALPNRKVVLLMSDGLQNTDPLVEVVGGQVRTTAGGTPTAFANQATTQIYTVTVGRGSAVNATINQEVATATKGFMMNTEDDASVLPTLFLQLLQNFHKYATVETLRIASASVQDAVPFETSIPITSTTRQLLFALTSDGARGLRLVVTPPNGAPQIVRDFATATSDNAILLSQQLPIAGFKSAGDWRVRIETASIPTNDVPIGRIPFHLIVMGDDVAVNSELSPVVDRYRPGRPVVVRARVRELGKNVTGIGTQPGDRLLVRMFRPGTSLGDLLSTSPAGTPPPSSEPRSEAEAKQAAVEATAAAALAQQEETLTLVDDGTNGDATAGDGIYSATFRPELEGHYNLLFGIEGKSARLGRFSRQQLRTIHVKPAPDEEHSTLRTAATNDVLRVTLTPRTATNHLVGPGWSGQFWFQAGSARPVRSHDNLDGTYSASLPFTGGAPPVRVHYIDEAVFVPESVTNPDDLSVPLGPSTVFTSTGGGASSRWRVFLDLGPNYPLANFTYDVNGDASLNLGIERVFTHFSLEAIFGDHRFDGEFGGDARVRQFSINAKKFFGPGPLQPFVHLGAGVYSYDPGTEKFGANGGGGLLWRINARWAIEGVYNYHSADEVEFSTAQVGVRVSF